MNRYHIETHSKRCFTLEEAFSLARRCKSRADFLQADPSLYRWARRTGLLDSILPRNAERNPPLTREQCLAQVKRYPNRAAQRSYEVCYRRIRRQGWEDLYIHLVKNCPKSTIASSSKWADLLMED